MPDVPLPASTDNDTVILWVVGVLVLAFVAVAKYLLDKIRANEARCLAEAARADEDRKAAHSEIKSLYQGVIHDQQQTQVQSNAAMVKLADALERNTRVVETYMQDEDTRTHRKRTA